MKKLLLAILLLCSSVTVKAETLTPVVVVYGSSHGQIYGQPACDGNAYLLTWFPFTGHVVKAYIFAASQAPAVDMWLRADTAAPGGGPYIIAEAHKIVGIKPGNPPLNYWEGERDFGKDSVYVNSGIWFQAACYGQGMPGATFEPYAIIYTRPTP